MKTGMDMIGMRCDFNEMCAVNEMAVAEIHGKFDLNSKLPHCLYHYTAIQGVLGIIGNREIWATSIDFLNDSSEVEYGTSIAIKLIEQRIKEAKDGDHIIRDHLLRVRYELLQHRSRSSYFVACFCETPDLLSQWRAYGQNGGYSINFNSHALHSSIHRMNDHDGGLLGSVKDRNCYFEKVFYDEGTQWDLVKSVLGICCELYGVLMSKHFEKEEDFIKEQFSQNNVLFNEFLERFAQYTAKKLLRFVTLFKHPSFAEEKEWRLVHKRGTEDCENLSFRPGTRWLIPYVKVKIDLIACLDSITCGPPYSPLSWQSIQTYMKSMRLEEKPVYGTATPLRY